MGGLLGSWPTAEPNEQKDSPHDIRTQFSPVGGMSGRRRLVGCERREGTFSACSRPHSAPSDRHGRVQPVHPRGRSAPFDDCCANIRKSEAASNPAADPAAVNPTAVDPRTASASESVPALTPKLPPSALARGDLRARDAPGALSVHCDVSQPNTSSFPVRRHWPLPPTRALAYRGPAACHVRGRRFSGRRLGGVRRHPDSITA